MKIYRLLYLIIPVLLSTSCTGDQPEVDPLGVKIDSVLSQMTLEEKVNMIHASSSFTSGGVERLNIPELVMSDGPHGVRYEHGRGWGRLENYDDSVTYLPTGICLAATWNRDLGYRFGSVLGAEANFRGKDIILGPGLNIIRSPLNGRNFEYLSEDPFLTAQMGIGYIKGVQDQGIAACAKHYVANNQETLRSGVDVKMSERALREIYLPAFKAAVEEAEVLSIMGAYNKFRGEYCMQNNYLANEILKDEFGFDGIYMSDWGAVHDTKAAYMGGTDLEMGTDLLQKDGRDYNKFHLAQPLIEAINAGELSDSLLNDKVRRILRVMYKTNTIGERKPGERNTSEHQALARKVAEEGIVLLKNNGILPLKAGEAKNIAVIGDNAIRIQHNGGGSSQVSALYEITPLEGIKNLLGEQAEINYYPGYEVSRENTTNVKLRKEAVAAAKAADLVIYAGGWIHNYNPDEWGREAYDAEGIDKAGLEMLYGQSELISQILDANQNTAVVLIGGGPVDMSQWLDKAPALLQAWYNGMEGGNALADILFGKTNPSGKLPMTFANELDKYPSHSVGEFPGTDSLVNYTEGIYVGYRYFDTYKIEPTFSFGFGLSYTDFEFSDLHVEKSGDAIKVSVNVKNTGDMDGSEVVQVYVHNGSEIEMPEQELKGFEKVSIASGNAKTVSLTLNTEDLKYYNETSSERELAHGTYEIRVGNSSRNILLTESLEL